MKGVHTDEKPLKCDICNDTFSVESLLKNHRKKVHDKTRPFECAICHKMFISKDGQKGLDQHFARFHELRNVENCPYCQKQYLRLPVHISTCSANPMAKWKMFKCPNCDKSYADKGGLNNHLKNKKCKLASRFRFRVITLT